MRHLRLALAASLLTPLGLCSLIPAPLTIRQAAANTDVTACSNIESFFDPVCWTTLQVDVWLQNWNKSTPTCPGATVDGKPANESLNCCAQGEAWSSCFLRHGLGRVGLDCSKINPNCAWQPSQRVNGTDTPPINYIAWSIYSINIFFASYSARMRTGVQPGFNLRPMITQLGVSATRISMINTVNSLTAGLPFLTATGVTGPILTGAQAFVSSLQDVPDVVKVLYPPGTASTGFSDTIPLSSLDGQISVLGQSIEDQLNRALAIIMSDVPTFLAFAKNGRWAAASPLSVAQDAGSLDAAARIYIVSEAMGRNGWFGVPFLNYTYNSQAEIEAANLFPPAPGAPGCRFNGGVLCIMQDTAVFWSPVSKRLFGLANKQKLPDAAARTVMEGMITNGWAMIQELFDGSFNATWTGNNLNLQLVNTVEGKLDFSAVGRLPMRKDRDKECPPGSFLVDGQTCNFGNIGDP